MSRSKLHKIWPVLCTVLLLLITGCASHRDFQLGFTDQIIMPYLQYPIRVRLEVSDLYLATEIKDKLGVSPIGTELLNHSTKVASKLFKLVTVED